MKFMKKIFSWGHFGLFEPRSRSSDPIESGCGVTTLPVVQEHRYQVTVTYLFTEI
jgi:hypothetical protein